MHDFLRCGSEGTKTQICHQLLNWWHIVNSYLQVRQVRPGKLGDDVKLIRMDANDINHQKCTYCEIKRKQSNNPT
jgi:hypothetical protein